MAFVFDKITNLEVKMNLKINYIKVNTTSLPLQVERGPGGKV